MMPSRHLKKMTLCALFLGFLTHPAFAVFEQQSFSTHLRLLLSIEGESVKFTHDDGELKLETYNIDVFEKLVSRLAVEKFNPEYIKKVIFDKKEFPAKPASIKLVLSSDNLEVFHFYQEKEKKEVVDLWINEEKVQRSIASTAEAEKIIEEAVLKLTEPVQIPLAPKVVQTEKKQVVKKKKEVKKKDKPSFVKARRADAKLMGLRLNTKRISKNKGVRKLSDQYRDYRYGAAFLWDYKSLSPQLEQDINLLSKTPDFFFPIKDREYTADKKEAHMQLSINFYRKEKWGLMNKSIRLYNERYGNDANFEVNEFLKANALLKSNIRNPNKGVVTSAINILDSVASSSQNYELIRAISRYVIQNSLKDKNYVQSLKYAKNLFVLSRKNFDPDMKEHSVKVILFSLAKLKQLSKIQEFLEDKYVMSTIPRQRSLAYEIYVALKIGKPEEALRIFNKNKSSITDSILPSIVYNVAESHFRLSEYKQALKFFDEFAAEYSFYKEASYARLRMAMCYDILEKDMKKITELYRNAVDRASIPEARYEAKIRYASLFLNRKKQQTEQDKEKAIFLEASDDEKGIITKNFKKLLWQVRLRSFINAKQYKKAMTYLESIPLQSLNPSERQSFHLDGTEILYGMMHDAYLRKDYPHTVRVWSLFKDKYTKSMRGDPIVHYTLADSYLKLGVMKKFNEEVAKLQSLKDTGVRRFPAWIERNVLVSNQRLMQELVVRKLIHEKKFNQVNKEIQRLESMPGEGVNPPQYYLANTLYHQENYQQAASAFEKILLNSKVELSTEAADNAVLNYVNSLFNTGQDEKLLKVSEALSEDVEQNQLSQSVLQRVRYLEIECNARKKNPNYYQLDDLATRYLKDFKESKRKYRVNYLMGMSKIKKNKIGEGKSILKKLLDDDKAPGYLKEMARSEMSMIELNNSSL
jgi:hypothetical protein